MEWLTDNIVSIFSILFGTGGIVLAIISRLLNQRKYSQEVRKETSEADLKGDEFWKQRYDVLQQEVENKDNWWKDRYDSLYKEYQNERTLTNDIVRSIRAELNNMRNDYEKQREVEKQKYDCLLDQYREFKEESEKKEQKYKQRIAQLEELVNSYVEKISKK